MSEGRLRLTILGGFLGSGKTTWLRHQLHEKAFGPVHVIVNEAANAPVDDALLHHADDITLLAGACVCCDGRHDLMAALLKLCNDRSGVAASALRLESIVLETSGLADPAAILALIQTHPILIRQIVVTEVIVVVDVQGALTQLQQEPLSRKQIESADRLILTKTDLVHQQDIDYLRATLNTLAPGAHQSAAQFGNPVTLTSISQNTRSGPLRDLTDQATAPIHACQLDLGQTVDWTTFTVWLSALLYARGDQIVRVKGVVRTPAGRLLLQTVRKSVQSPEILPDPEAPISTDNRIAIIGRGFRSYQIKASLAQFSA